MRIKETIIVLACSATALIAGVGHLHAQTGAMADGRASPAAVSDSSKTVSDLSKIPKTSKPPLVPFNTASTYYAPVQFVLRPSEIGLFGNLAEDRAIVGTASTYATNLGRILSDEPVRIGIGAQASRAFDSKGQKTDAISPVFGLDVRGFRVGVKLPFSGVSALELLQPSLQLGYSGPAFKITADLAPKTGRSMQNAVLNSDFISGDIAFSGMLTLDGGKAPKFGLGCEYRIADCFALGAAFHPEKAFFNGLANPSLSLRYVGKTATANLTLQPQSRMLLKCGIGLKY